MSALLFVFLLFFVSSTTFAVPTWKKTLSTSPSTRLGSKSSLESHSSPVDKFDWYLEEAEERVPSIAQIFQYANLEGIKAFSFEGLLFLSTNIPFVLASQYLRTGSARPDLQSLAHSLDISFVCSLLYHTSQLWYGPARKEVKRFLFIDYISAFFTCSIVTLEIFPLVQEFGTHEIALAPLFYASAGLGCLALSWRYEYGRLYLFWHGLWHVLSSYAAVLLGAPLPTP